MKRISAFQLNLHKAALPQLTMALMCLVALVSCRKDKPEPPEETAVVVGNSGGLYITNEGNFQWGNATVSYYDVATGSVAEDLFQHANGSSLGDVCQSMTIFNGKGYLVMNNSNKVVVVDPQSFVSTATITGFDSPRYILPVSNAKAYVTDFHANSIAVVDLANNTITGGIPCPSATEELVLAYGKAFVTAPQRDKVYVISTVTDQITDSITVSAGGASIVQDMNGKLWVLCNNALYRIDPFSHGVEATFSFTAATSPWRLRINGTHDMLYFLDTDVYRMSITAAALPTSSFIPASGRNFYGLGVDPTEGSIYVADAIDYVQRGVVYRYGSDGSERANFLAGIVPGGFCFN